MKRKQMERGKRLLAVFLSFLTVIGIIPMAAFAFTPQEGQMAYSYEGAEYRGSDGQPYLMGARHYILYDSAGNVRVEYSEGGYSYGKLMVRNDAGEEHQVYCIESGVPYGPDGTNCISYNGTNSSYFQMLPYPAQYGIMLTSVYGWQPGKKIPVAGCNEDDYMVATQILLWEYQQQIRTSPSDLHDNVHGVEARAFLQTIEGRPARKCYDWMLAQMAKHTAIPSFASNRISQAAIHTLKYDGASGKYTLTLEDANHTLDDLKFNNGSGISVARDGNRYTFTSDRMIGEPVTLTTLKDIPQVRGDMLIWGAGGYQTRMCGAEDPVVFYMKLKTETSGTGHIEKTSEDGKVEGVRFRITGNGEDRLVTTGRDGMVDITLNPGTYRVTEIVDGRYEDQESQDVTIVSGQTAAVTFNNQLKRGSLEVVKTSEDQFVEGVSFHLYGTSLSGEAVDAYAVTDRTGKATFSDVLVSGEEPYLLEEVHTAVRYVVPEAQKVTIQWGQTAYSSFHNVLKKFRIKVTKADRDAGTAQGDASLEGAVYGLYQGDRLMASYTTDAEGVFTTDYFACGDDWTLRETAPSEGYLLDPTVYEIPAGAGEFQFEYNPVYSKVFEKVIRGRIRLVKHIDASLEPVPEAAGIKKTLEAANAAVISVGTELESGPAGSLEKRTAAGVETEAGTEAEGRTDAGTKAGTESEGSEGADETIPEEHRPVEIPPEDLEASGGQGIVEQPEEGAEFEIYLTSAGSYENAKKTERDLLVTDSDGFAVTKDLPYGRYTVHQTKGQEGQAFVKDFTVMIRRDDETYSFILNNQTKSSLIRIEKHDAETGKIIPASGIGFQVRDASTGELVTQTIYYPTPMEITTYFTNDEGWLMMPGELRHGEYELIEVETCHGYVLDSEPVPFAVDGIKDVVVVEKHNMPQKGRITVTKVGEVWSSVSVSGGENGTEAVYTPVYEAQTLAGAEYEVRAAEDILTLDGTLRAEKGEVVDTITTGPDGKAVTKELYLGSYEVIETKAPVPMVLNSEPRQVRLAYAGQEVALTEAHTSIYNERQRAKISLEKTMEQNEAFGIGGNGEVTHVTFGLYAARDLTAADGSVIPADGLIEILSVSADGGAAVQTDLPPGEYYLRERATDAHYFLSDEKYPVVFAYAGQERESVEIKANQGEAVENSLIYGSVSGKKTDAEGGALHGACVGLFSPDAEEFTEETAIRMTISSEGGEFRFDDIPYGNWIIREIAPPEGFTLCTDLFEITISEDMQAVEFVIVNEPIRASLRLSKTDQDYPDRKLSGAVFEVYQDVNVNEKLDGDDVLLGTMEETGAGEYVMTEVPYGGILVKETKAPEGFCLDEEEYYIFVERDGETYEVENMDGKGFVNRAKQGGLKIVKTSSDGKKEGFSFRVVGEGYDETFQTDAGGEILIEKLRIGPYTISEVADGASAGYKLPDPVRVEVVADGMVTVDVYNDKEKGEEKVTVTTDYPKTGDGTNVWFWTVLTVAGAGGIAVLLMVNYRKKKNIK